MNFLKKYFVKLITFLHLWHKRKLDHIFATFLSFIFIITINSLKVFYLPWIFVPSINVQKIHLRFTLLGSNPLIGQQPYKKISYIIQEWSSNSRQKLNENLETLYLDPTLFYHLPGFYLKTGFLNPHSWPWYVITQGWYVVYFPKERDRRIEGFNSTFPPCIWLLGDSA